jgi:hypothetical protein
MLNSNEFMPPTDTSGGGSSIGNLVQQLKIHLSLIQDIVTQLEQGAGGSPGPGTPPPGAPPEMPGTSVNTSGTPPTAPVDIGAILKGPVVNPKPAE